MSRKLPLQLDDMTLLHESAFLKGEWDQSISQERFDVEGMPITEFPCIATEVDTSLNPGTGQVSVTCPINQAADVDTHVRTPHEAFQQYSQVNPRQRAKQLLKWHDLITSARDDIAKLLVYETGKPLVEARGEVDFALGCTWWFAGEADRIRGSIAIPSVSEPRILVIKQPIGVSVALVPSNFPVAMVICKVAAALAAGYTMTVKPSPERPFTVLALEDLALRAGFPPGALNIITTDNANTPSVSEALCKHALVGKVTFAGSTNVGKLIAKHCSVGLKKVTLELGGNCPLVVVGDADLEQSLH